jgi:hypothetical protein
VGLFGFFRRGGDEIKWPVDENGESAAPAFLMRLSGSQMDAELTVNLLKAYGIPVANGYPGNGGFTKLLFGATPAGTDIYVPEALLDDARNILSADIMDDDELEAADAGESDWEEKP